MQRYRGFDFALDGPRRRLEVPEGAVTLMLGFGEPVRISPVAPAGDASLGGSFTSVLAGLQTTASVGEHDGRLAGIEVILTPWAAFTLLDTPMRELTGRLVDPRTLLGPSVWLLTEELAAAPDWGTRFAILDTTLRRSLATGPASAPGVVRAWAALRHGAGASAVAKVAADVGMSQRQLDRRFGEQIGLAPKQASRVLRLQRALRLITSGLPLAEVAAACAYFDQAHLSRDCTALTGQPPRRFLATRTAMSYDGRLLDRVDGEVTSALLPN